MDTQKRLHENISALVDGELADSELELAFAEIDTPEGRFAWDAYHQIGHTLRSDGCGFELSGRFATGLAARLAFEPVLMLEAEADAGAATDGAEAGLPMVAAATILP